jgi:hypothetical protein
LAVFAEIVQALLGDTDLIGLETMAKELAPDADSGEIDA